MPATIWKHFFKGIYISEERKTERMKGKKREEEKEEGGRGKGREKDLKNLTKDVQALDREIRKVY